MKITSNQDSRYEKTEKQILDAFEELILEKDYQKITVMEVAKRANINRKTFYLHFDSLASLFSVFADILADLAFSTILDFDFNNPTSYNPDSLSIAIEKLLTNYNQITKRLVTNIFYRPLARDINNSIRGKFVNKLSKKYNNPSKIVFELTADFIGSGFAKILKEWYANPEGISVKEISALISSIIFEGIKGVAKTI